MRPPDPPPGFQARRISPAFSQRRPHRQEVRRRRLPVVSAQRRKHPRNGPTPTPEQPEEALSHCGQIAPGVLTVRLEALPARSAVPAAVVCSFRVVFSVVRTIARPSRVSTTRHVVNRRTAAPDRRVGESLYVGTGRATMCLDCSSVYERGSCNSILDISAPRGLQCPATACVVTSGGRVQPPRLTRVLRIAASLLAVLCVFFLAVGGYLYQLSRSP